MPAGVVRSEADEKMWDRAKTSVGRSYKKTDKAYWPTVNKVFQAMKRSRKRQLKKMRKAPIQINLRQTP